MTNSLSIFMSLSNFKQLCKLLKCTIKSYYPIHSIIEQKKKQPYWKSLDTLYKIIKHLYLSFPYEYKVNH